MSVDDHGFCHLEVCFEREEEVVQVRSAPRSALQKDSSELQEKQVRTVQRAPRGGEQHTRWFVPSSKIVVVDFGLS